MNLISYFRSLAARFFRRAHTEREMAAELQSHIQFRTNELERSGLTRFDAERQARIEFGST